MTLVLASGSPRRRALLEEAGMTFLVCPVEVDESPPPCMPPDRVVLALASRKARAAAAEFSTDRILGADTVVVLDGAVFGKPLTDEGTRKMLRKLSGRDHEVWTGVSLLDAATGRESTRAVCTRVTFRTLSSEEIDRYASTGEGNDKAGGYGIQGAAAAFVESLEGPRDNVVGLPMDAVREILR